MAVVTFVPADFKAAWPEFMGVPDARCTSMFSIASTTILDNTDNSPVMDADARLNLFYLLVGHLLVLYGGNPTVRADGTLNNTPPGRISSATQGSVSTSFELQMPQGSALAAWYNQTQYGSMYWMATAQWRRLTYLPSGGSGIGTARAYGVPPFNRPGGV